MSAAIATTLFHVSNAQTIIETQMEQNRVEVLVMTPLQWISVLQDHAKKNPAKAKELEAAIAQTSFKQYWNSTLAPNIDVAFVEPAGLLGADLYQLGKTLHALGYTNVRTLAKVHNGKTYLIFKGSPGLRNVLKGTRYLATNPQIVQLGLGMKGLKNVAHGGFVLGMVVASGIEITDFFYKDEKTMYDLVGGIGVEVVKAGLATIAGLVVGAAITTVTAIVVWPLIGFVAVAFGAGWYLNHLDNKHDIKRRVAAALKLVTDDLEPGYYKVEESALLVLDILSRSKSDQTNAKLREWDRAVKDAFRLLLRRRF
jgi:hypothetical protein